MGDRAPLAVKGLKEFTRSLKQVDAALPKGVRVALNGCSDFLIGKARPLIPTRTGAAARSLKARSSQSAVRIAMGGRAAPYMPWLDFGGRVGRGKSVARPFLTEGRYLYPTLRNNRDEFAKIMEKALVGVAEAAGLDVH
jgi:hypothetical protein